MTAVAEAARRLIDALDNAEPDSYEICHAREVLLRALDGEPVAPVQFVTRRVVYHWLMFWFGLALGVIAGRLIAEVLP